MHELPRDLNKSLRSWRGSIYDSVRADHSDDVEKGIAPLDYGSKLFDENQNPTETSLVLHPTKSTHGLREAANQQQSPQQQQAATHDAPAPPGHGHSLTSLFHQSTRHGTSTPPQRGQQPTNDSNLTFQPRRLYQNQHPNPNLSQVPQTPASGKQSIFTGPKYADPDPASSRLDDDKTPLPPAEFYELMGMRQPSDSSKDDSKPLGVPHGMYTQMCDRLSDVQWQYVIFDAATYALLALQLILSAVFIILGSLTNVDSHIAIAVLGAVSIVVAGLLALMKGQGLPNRLRQERDDLRNVIFEANELYWDVGARRPVLFKDVKQIREDFLRVLETARRNHPDTWTPAAKRISASIEQQRNGGNISTNATASPNKAGNSRPDNKIG